jgi:hypothetical protein
MTRKNYKFQKEEFEDEEEELSSQEEDIEEEDEAEESEEASSEDSEAVIYQNEAEADDDQVQADETVTQEDKELFNSYLYDIRKNIDELNKKLNFLNTSLEGEKAEMGYGLSYLDAKNNMMLMYLTDLIMYSTMKTAGQDIDSSDIVKQMIHTKTIMERSKVIDLKIKTQIDRLIKLSEKEETTTGEEISNENLRVK